MNDDLYPISPTSESMDVTAIIKKHRQRLFTFIRGRVKSKEEAEDILAEVCYKLAIQTHLENVGSMSGWLFRVAKNELADHYRKLRAASIQPFYEDSNREIHLGEALWPVTQDSESFKTSFWQQLGKALDELPEAQRSVFMRNEFDGLTLQQIADSDELNIKTIISRKLYAVKHLRERMRVLYEDLD